MVHTCEAAATGDREKSPREGVPSVTYYGVGKIMTCSSFGCSLACNSILSFCSNRKLGKLLIPVSFHLLLHRIALMTHTCCEDVKGYGRYSVSQAHRITPNTGSLSPLAFIEVQSPPLFICLIVCFAF